MFMLVVGSQEETKMFRFGKTPKARTLKTDDKEKFLRCWWMAYKVADRIVSTHESVTYGFLVRDYLDPEKEFRQLTEITAYSMSFVLDKLRNDIEALHGWTNETFTLNIDYQLHFGNAFDMVFNVKDTFGDVLLAYYDQNKYVLEELEGAEDESDWPLFSETGDFLVENLYLRRVSLIFDIVRPDVVVSNAKQFYSGLALPFYEDAFFNRNALELKKEVIQMHHQNKPRGDA
jgi:hypothetical protein